MSFRLVFFSFVTFLSVLSAAAEPITREEQILAGRKKASYRHIFAGYKPGFDLAPYFSATAVSAPTVEQLRAEWGDRASLRFSLLQAVIENQDGVVRAEIEDPLTQQGARALLQMSLLRLRVMGPEQAGLWMASEGEVWQRVLQNIPFEEATHIALLFAGELRSLIWTELLRKIKGAGPKSPLGWADWSTRVAALRPAWPVDRVLLSEARKSLPPAGLLVATHIATELQKNPHRSAATLRKTVKGGAMQKLEVLNALWSEADVKAMERELDQWNEIRLRLAHARSLQAQGVAPKSLAELVSQGFIEAVPLCYHSGKAWSLTQLGGNEGP